MNISVTVVIPVWNLWEATANCLRSLAEHSPPNVEVVVVDNGSDDATVHELGPLGASLWGERFCALRMPENLGFAKACNAGARKSTGELLFFLNNDTTLTPGWLPPLVAAFEAGSLGAAGPLLLYPDGTVQHCGIAFTPFCQVCHIYEHFPGAHPLLQKKRLLQAITGAAFMVRRRLFLESGGFFEEYRNGLEDVDFCFVLRDAGYRLDVVGESRIVHHTSRTPGRFDHEMQNSRLFYSRWLRKITPDLHLLGNSDGYVLELGNTLNCWLTLNVEAKAGFEMLAGASGFSREDCFCQLEREPLWREGWLRLVDWQERDGDLAGALATCQRMLYFFPAPDMYGRMLRLLRKAGMLEQMTQLMQGIRIDMESASPAQREEKVRLARNKAAMDGDSLLLTVFDDWLARYAGQVSNA